MGVPYSVAASGTAPLSYQWRKNGSAISGATSATYSITAASVADAGSYDVVVTSSCGAVVSNVAILTVNTAPAITTQPDSQTVRAGQTVTFTSTASGTPPPSVQWEVKSGSGPFTSIPGATSTTLLFTATLANDGNKYRAVFTNSCGTAQSRTVKLTVKP
ncbi:MAG TPA: immunoglobulin domain-containing protein [Blastocatellia bacterium]|nr:immunoglobulin domain-containing protein [Blastocatellia bacterium]